MSTSPDTTGERYEVLIQGKIHPWGRDAISVPEIRELGGFPPGSTVVEEDFTTGRERPLSEDDIHELARSEEHTSELQSPCNLVCRLLLEKKKKHQNVVCS